MISLIITFLPLIICSGLLFAMCMYVKRKTDRFIALKEENNRLLKQLLEKMDI